MSFKDYYTTLGVPRDATDDAIKKAYRRLARKFHPDVSQESDATEKFQELGEAYEVLSDPEKRAAYDKFGADWKIAQEGGAPPGWNPADGSGDFAGGSAAFDEFLDSLFSGGRGRAGGFAARGQDYDTRISVSLRESFDGAEKSLRIALPEVGSDGRVKQTQRTLNVRIPRGITAGQRIRLGGQGAPGMNQGGPGDLFLEVEFQAHPVFRADGRDIHVELPVTPWEAALGAKVTVPTLGGKVDLRLPPESKPGQRLRLKGRGLPGKPPGDQFVTLSIVAPPAQTDEQRKLYERMAELMPDDPRAAMLHEALA